MPMNIDHQVALMREKGFVFDDHYKIRGIMANDADICLLYTSRCV